MMTRYFKIFDSKSINYSIGIYTDVNIKFTPLNRMSGLFTNGNILCEIIPLEEINIDNMNFWNSTNKLKIISTQCLDEISTWKFMVHNGFFKNNICHCATIYDNIEILKWAHENYNNEEKCADYVIWNAADNNNFEILKWAYENGYPWDDDTLFCAIKNNNLEMAKWAREHGCPWGENTYYGAFEAEDSIEIMNWLYKNDCPWEKIFENLEDINNVEILKWIIKKLRVLQVLREG